MKGSEIKTIAPISIFVFLFSSCFIIALIYLLAVNLELMPRVSPETIQRLRAKIDLMRPLPKSLAWAAIVGLVAGIGGTLIALIYNVFAGIFGGVRAEIKE